VSYSYSRIGQQKRQEQAERRGRRISILGLWQPDEGFEYALACGSFQQHQLHYGNRLGRGSGTEKLAQTGKLTVVVQDNGSLHTSNLLDSSGNDGRNKDYFCSSYLSIVLK